MSSIEKILTSLREAKQPLSLAELQALHPKIARRSLQRYLSQLIERGNILATGQRRARRFYIKTTLTETSISYDSLDILDYINQPITKRHPVGYQRELLEDYEPNITWYLAKPIRDLLRAWGDTGENKLPAGTYGREIFNRFLIDLSWASSHLEGNTYSRLDTVELIKHGKQADDKSLTETQMILNHKAAIEFLVENAGTINFNRATVFSIHSLLSENLLLNPNDEGQIRQQAVDIGNSVYRPLFMPAQLEELFDTILKKCSEINDPFEQALFIMVHLPYLQPFIDVNKRTSRLSANIPFIKHNLCPLTFLHVSKESYINALFGVYEMGRIELLRDLFVSAYDSSVKEYQIIKQNVAKPSPLRLAYRNAIKKVIYDIVTQPNSSPLTLIEKALNSDVQTEDRDDLKAILLQELKNLHEGNIVRYGLNVADFRIWQDKQKNRKS